MSRSFRFVAALCVSQCVRWKALQIEQRDVRRKARLQPQEPLQREAVLVAGRCRSMKLAALTRKRSPTQRRGLSTPRTGSVATGGIMDERLSQDGRVSLAATFCRLDPRQTTLPRGEDR